MNKIDFENLPSTKTPISAENLNLLQNIVESGSNSNGDYIKYSDGTMICWAKTTDTVSLTSQSNQVYYANRLMTFPVAFIQAPVVVPSVTQTGGIFFAGLGNNAPGTASVQIRVLSMVSQSNVSITFSYIAIGKWK